MKLAFTLTLSLFFSSVFSQNTDSLKRIYNTQTIYRTGNLYMKGGEKLSFQDLNREFDFSELAFADYKMAKKFKTLKTIMTVATMATVIAAPSIVKRDKPSTFYTVIGLQFAFTMGSSTFGKLSNQHLDRALWQRNKDVLFGP